MRGTLSGLTSKLLLVLIVCSLAGCSRDSGASLFADGQAAYQAKDFAKAASLYERACVAGEMRACTSLGTMAINGEGGRQDASWARGLYEKACKGGDAEGCEKLRIMTAAATPQAAATTTEATPTATETAPGAAPDTTAQPMTAHPSFDCAAARNQAERLICSDDDLAKRDAELDRLYRHVRHRVTDEEALIAEQRDWIALRRDVCPSKECLHRAYARRERELEDWVGP